MKKCILLFWLLACTATLFAQTPFYKFGNPNPGSGALTNGYVFGVNSLGARAQFFCPAGGFGTTPPSITIGRLYFFADATPFDTITYTTISITLGELTTLPSSIGSWATAQRSTQVLSAANYTLMVHDSSWFYIDLATPFTFDPTKNLMVDIAVGAQTPFSTVWNIKSASGSQYYGAGSATAGSPNLTSLGSSAAIGIDPVRGYNNAGIEKPLYPSVCANNQDVVVKVKNSGQNVINTLNVGWTVNGVPQAPLTLNFPIDTFGSAKYDTLITLGNVSFATGAQSITAWTYLPNGVQDIHTTDDSVTFTMASSLTGTYTVGSASASFASMTAAVNALYTYGVCGPVLIRVDTGTYFEQVNLTGRINGASPVNTVTFEGVDQAKTVLAWSSTIVNAKHVIRLQNVSYVTFRNFTIRTLNPTYGWGVHLRDSCVAIGIKKCVIDMSVSSASVAANNTAGITLSGPPTGTCIPGPCATTLTVASRADSLEIDSNTILYGYESINLTGNATTNIGRSNKIRGNTLLYAYQNSINLVSQENVQVLNNTIFLRQTGAASVGIFANPITSTATGTPSVIGGNKIYGYATAGISLNGSNSADSTNKGRIINNMVGGMEQLVDANPIYITGCKNWSVANNSINRDFPGTNAITASGIRILGTTSNISILNNIISISKAGTALPLHILANTNVDSMDRNIFYRADISNGQVISLNGTTYTTANYKGGGGFNTNSTILRPLFRNDTSLYLQSTCGFPVTQPLSYVSTDVDGTVRGNPPVAGAHELVRPNNNVAVLSVLQPASPIAAGTYTMKVLVQNLGANPVTSFNVTYQVNGNSPVTQAWTGTLNACDSVTVTVNGLSIGVNDSIAQLSVYTSAPNNVTDADRSNDTLRMKLYAPLIGEYTIGGAGAPFATFTEATNALQSAGIKGAVRFNVTAGTYMEQVTLTGPIVGATPANTITFEGTDATNRIINFAANSAAPHTVKIDNAKYVSFRNLGILTSGSTWGWGVQISGAANGCKIKNCIVSITGAGTSNTTANYTGITVSGSTLTTAVRVDSLEIDSNTILYGYYGVNIYAATGAANVGQFNRIRNNTITNAQQYSVYLTYQQTPEVSGNKITCRGSNAGVGIYCQNVTTPATGSLYTIIRNNRISNYATAGIYMNTSTNASATLKGYIINNTMGGEKLAAGNSLYLTSSTNWYICNNSINHDFATTTATTAAAVRIVGAVTASFGNTLINNIIAVTGTGTALPLYTQVVGNIDAMDYNLMYRADTTNGLSEYLGANVTLAAFRGSNGFNKNSLMYKPGFTSNTDLTPNPNDSCAWSMNGRGTYLAYAPTDINGVQRAANTYNGVPDIGAYEFTPVSVPPMATAVPATITQGGTQVFLFGGDTVARINWNTTTPTTIQVRQYSGVRPVLADTTINYMYFYTSVTYAPLSVLDLYYHDNWKGTHGSESTIRLYQMDSGQTTWSSVSGLSSVDTNRNVINMPFFYTFAPVTYTSGSDNQTLPVKLLDLHAGKVQQDVLVQWLTASEEGSDRYEVERSADGKAFTYAGTVKAAGNSSASRNYLYTDHFNELPASGNMYYRLKMIDLDGGYSYSKTVQVSWKDGVQPVQVQVYPNPFVSEVWVSTVTPSAGVATLVLTDMTGKEISRRSIAAEKGSTSMRLDETGLQPGIYFLAVELNGERQLYKLVKQ